MMTHVPSSASHAIVYDTETTGLIENGAIPLKSQPHVIELCALKLDLAELRRIIQLSNEYWPAAADRFVCEAEMWTSLFHHSKLEEETTKITGITQDMVNVAPSFVSMLPSLQQFMLGVGALVGHNLSFDRDVLAIELRRLDALMRFPWPPVHICTVEETETVEGFRLGLNDLHEKLTGLRFSEHHRAEPDTRATARIFVELVRMGKVRVG